MSATMMPYQTSEELLCQLLPAAAGGADNVGAILEAMTQRFYALLLLTPRPETAMTEQLWSRLEPPAGIHFFQFRGRRMGLVQYRDTDPELVRQETMALEAELERRLAGLQTETGATVNISMGRPFQGLLHLQDAYSELVNSTQTFSLRPRQLVVSEYDIVADPALLGDPYPQSELERRLVDNILDLEIEKAHRLMEDIIRSEQSSLRLSLSFLPRMSKRVEWILIVLHVPRNSGDAKSAEIFSYPYRIQYAEGNAQGEALVHEFFEKLEDYYQAFRFNVGKDISQITGFIQENYADINLDATMICDRFRISPSYLSHLFKKRTGVKLIDYIHGARLAQAKRLLAETDMTIKEIGAAVGYVSNASFSTTFKKYESITPRQYRDAMRDRAE